MIRFRYSLPLVAAALVGVAGLALPSKADAAFEVQIVTSVGTTTIVDGGAGDLDGSVNNQISFNYHDSAYAVIGSLAFTNTPGTATFAILDINYTISAFNPAGGNTTGGAGSLSASATGFTQPTQNPLTLTSTINGNGSGTGTLNAQQFADTSNTLFGTSGATPGVQGPFNVGAVAGYGSTAAVQFNQSGAYSLTDVLTFNLNSGAHTTGDFSSEVTPVPAPVGLVLVLTAFPALAVGGWVRRRRAVVA